LRFPSFGCSPPAILTRGHRPSPRPARPKASIRASRIAASYGNRKIGNYELAQVWYDKALAIDPNHVRTWQYYGMWYVEQGNMLKAADFLEKIRLICGGTGCKEYQDLKGAMEGTVSY